MADLSSIERVSKIVSLLAIPIVLGVGGWLIQRSVSESSIKKDYVGLAVNILQNEKSASDPKLREWAVQLLNHHSPVKFNSETANALSSGLVILPQSISGASHRNKPTEVFQGDIVIVKNPGTIGFSAIELVYKDDRSVYYQWRFVQPNAIEQNGVGKLYEEHVVREGVNHAVGQTLIYAGPFVLEWSFGSPKSSWIYSLPPVEVSTIRGVKLMDVTASDIPPRPGP